MLELWHPVVGVPVVDLFPLTQSTLPHSRPLICPLTQSTLSPSIDLYPLTWSALLTDMQLSMLLCVAFHKSSSKQTSSLLSR